MPRYDGGRGEVVVRGRGRLPADERPVVVGVGVKPSDVEALALAIVLGSPSAMAFRWSSCTRGRDGFDPTHFVAEIADRHALLTVRLEQTRTHPTTALLDAARRAGWS